jgi:transposase
VFLDEMAILLGMMRDRGRSPEGERLYDIKPYYRGSRVTVIGAISQDKVLAIKVLGKSMTGEEFKEFLQEELAPQLWQGAGVVMDNLAAHKVAGVAEILEAVGAKAIYNAPYSCEFNPIEHLWWSLKAFIRNFVPKTAIAVAQLLKIGVMLCSSSQLRNYFIHCCYCPS